MEETFTTEEELDSIESYELDDPFNNWAKKVTSSIHKQKKTMPLLEKV